MAQFGLAANAVPSGSVGRGSECARDDQVARENWMDRTDKSIVVGETHRIRSDLPAAVGRATAEGLDRLWFAVDGGLGRLRPRTCGLQQALLFARYEDLVDVMRSSFAIEPPSSAFAFFSPLGQGVALCTEDTPGPCAARGLSAAVCGEYLQLCCGDDLSPALQVGILDFVARRDSDGATRGIGESGIESVRASVEEGKALTALALIAMSSKEWTAATKTDSTGALSEQAASVVRYLTRSRGGAGLAAFQQVLREVAEGRPTLDAFAVVYGLRDDAAWRQFDNQWRAFAVKEKSDPIETRRERLAFLGEGLRMIESAGSCPADFAALETELKDRKFAWPLAWRPGFSQVSAVDSCTFTPSEPYKTPAKPKARSPRDPAFAFGVNPKAAPTTPPTIVVSNEHGKALTLTWLKTRAEPEAPWVWSIGD